MHVFFLDDSRQRNPTRQGMGPLVAVGGVCVAEEALRPLELALEDLCRETGFPEGDAGEFKWSPKEEHWMRRDLVQAARRDFFFAALGLAAEHDVKAIVVLEDTTRGQADAAAPSAEDDVVKLFLERANNYLYPDGRGLVIADRPGGHGQEDEDRFLARCMATLRSGTRFVQLDRISLTLTTPSHNARLLQLADVVTGATTACVAGEARYAPPVFELIRPLLREEGGRVGGVGLKIQPDLRYVNLYHWLLGDDYYRRGNTGVALPRPNFCYAASPDVS
jgi:hypothetical protein